jgi:hexosaminidase
VKFKSTIGQIDPRKIKFDIGDQNVDYWPIIKSRFEKQIENKIPEDEELRIGGKVLNVKLLGLDKFPEVAIIKQEEYSLTSHLKGNEIIVTITSSSYFGVRHGLETLAQLIIYDELEGMLKIPSDVEIFDGPKFEYRGFSLDTSRNFFSTESIKRTIDAMAMVKMNVFHWHITDSNSFPIEINSQPHLSKFGAYSKKKTYRADDVKEIVKFAAASGIEIIPEFVIPAHVGMSRALITIINPYRHPIFSIHNAKPL